MPTVQLYNLEKLLKFDPEGLLAKEGRDANFARFGSDFGGEYLGERNIDPPKKLVISKPPPKACSQPRGLRKSMVKFRVYTRAVQKCFCGHFARNRR